MQKSLCLNKNDVYLEENPVLYDFLNGCIGYHSFEKEYKDPQKYYEFIVVVFEKGNYRSAIVDLYTFIEDKALPVFGHGNKRYIFSKNDSEYIENYLNDYTPIEEKCNDKTYSIYILENNLYYGVKIGDISLNYNVNYDNQYQKYYGYPYKFLEKSFPEVYKDIEYVSNDYGYMEKIYCPLKNETVEAFNFDLRDSYSIVTIEKDGLYFDGMFIGEGSDLSEYLELNGYMNFEESIDFTRKLYKEKFGFDRID